VPLFYTLIMRAAGRKETDEVATGNSPHD